MNLVWLRNDLRLDDNPALFHACEQASQSNVCVIYCETPTQWRDHHEATAKLGLRSSVLTDLQHRLATLGIELSVLKTDTFEQCTNIIDQYCRDNSITDVWFNTEVAVDEQRRDQQVQLSLKANAIRVHRCEADFLVPPETMKTLQGGYYKVFTPWYRKWLQQLTDHTTPLPEPSQQGPALPLPSQPIKLEGSGDYRDDLWPGNERAAHARLQTFCEERMHHYLDQRDIPSLNGTSTLSPYLASGMISPHRCLQVIQQTKSLNGQSWREDPWLRELAWREFYRYLMLSFPQLSKDQPFKAHTQFLQWEHNPELVSAWQQGQTGYPIIDAAMRQLLRTGWMHNRLRMLTASFFTKLMLEHWREGEAYFMQQLLDGDFASNNGGWQWSASTGCDASPWFRVFNPTRQSEKFDPQGAFIRKMVPELAEVDAKAIHNPPLELRKRLNYPAPIIDYAKARERVLERFKNLNAMMDSAPPQ